MELGHESIRVGVRVRVRCVSSTWLFLSFLLRAACVDLYVGGGASDSFLLAPTDL